MQGQIVFGKSERETVLQLRFSSSWFYFLLGKRQSSVQRSDRQWLDTIGWLLSSLLKCWDMVWQDKTILYTAYCTKWNN